MKGFYPVVVPAYRGWTLNGEKLKDAGISLADALSHLCGMKGDPDPSHPIESCLDEVHHPEGIEWRPIR